MTIEERIDRMVKSLELLKHAFDSYINENKCKTELTSIFIDYTNYLKERKDWLENVYLYLDIFTLDEYERLTAIIDYYKEYMLSTYEYSLKNCGF